MSYTPPSQMPLSPNATDLISANLERIQRGERVTILSIGILTDEQLAAINAYRDRQGFRHIIGEVVFYGSHVYKSRIAGDGYIIEDVIDQISSAMDSCSVFLETEHMTTIENPNTRPDRYGNQVRDRAVFECSTRHPRPELFSVVPKGDRNRPKMKGVIRR